MDDDNKVVWTWWTFERASLAMTIWGLWLVSQDVALGIWTAATVTTAIWSGTNTCSWEYTLLESAHAVIWIAGTIYNLVILLRRIYCPLVACCVPTCARAPTADDLRSYMTTSVVATYIIFFVTLACVLLLRAYAPCTDAILSTWASVILGIYASKLPQFTIMKYLYRAYLQRALFPPVAVV